jgi:Protein of unknown function (DUF2591)
MKTNELTGAALDWAVAKCMTGGEIFQSGRVAHAVVLHVVGGTTAPYFVKDSGVVRCAFEPSTSWAQGGPIIEREKIGSLHEAQGVWSASTKWDDPAKVFYGKTKLIAAMRCYVASKLGDNIELPQELTC